MAPVAQALAAARELGVLAMMDTDLFTAHSIVVFAILTSAIALIFSVLGLATTYQTRAEIEHQFERGSAASTSISDDRAEWNLLKEQFHVLVRERSDNIEDFLDMQFRGRLSELIYQAARRNSAGRYHWPHP
jgi:hypothetical protein